MLPSSSSYDHFAHILTSEFSMLLKHGENMEGDGNDLNKRIGYSCNCFEFLNGVYRMKWAFSKTKFLINNYRISELLLSSK